jgi:DNA polymerase V
MRPPLLPSSLRAATGAPTSETTVRAARVHRDDGQVVPSLIALVDCNSFYASCERALDPSLRDKPVAVLSNNDGCIIARSDEVKDLGVPMGVPLFKVRHLLEQHGVIIKSANFNIYGEYSAKVMSVLRDEAPACEIYSVDEAFLDLSGLGPYVSIEPWCQRLRQRILTEIGIPVSIGVGPTKVIAKLANRVAKSARTTYVEVLTESGRLEYVMRKTPVEQLWGIGRRNALKLAVMGIRTAWELRQCNTEMLLRERSIVEVRMVHELRGQPCLDMIEQHAPKQQLATTRSFGKTVTDLSELESAIAYFVRGSVRKLRKQRSAARQIFVFANTNPFARGEPLIRLRKLVTLSTPSSHPPELLRHSIAALREIYRPGLRYKKAGVILLDIRPDDSRQTELFGAVRAFDRVDKLNWLMADVNLKHERDILYWGSFHRNEFGWKPNSAYATTDAAIPESIRVTDAERDRIRPWW